jgi:hypothetical protein
MARVDNWPRVHAEFIEERRAMTFEWGKQDCCLFVADWVTRLTGVDPAAQWRGKYTNERGAALCMKRNGGDVLAFASKVFAKQGWPVCDVRQARRGDVACVETPMGPALGVCAGRDVFAPGADGLVVVPTLQALRAWRID